MPQEARAYSAAGGKGILSRRKRSGSGASEDGRCPALRHKQERSQGINPPKLWPGLLIWVFSKQRFQITQNDRFLISLPGKSSLRGHTQPQESELLRGLRGWTVHEREDLPGSYYRELIFMRYLVRSRVSIHKKKAR